MLGSGPLAVPGTLSLPRATGPLPRAWCCSLGRALDRDETIGRNKPLKDMAWGLASRGMAVLRFDKVTYAHPGEVKADRDFTLVDEYLPHARRGHPAARPAPRGRRSSGSSSLGHSLGGTVAPRVAAAEPVRRRAGHPGRRAEPLHWAIVRQIRYLASLDPATAAATKPAIEAMSGRRERSTAPTCRRRRRPSELPLRRARPLLAGPARVRPRRGRGRRWTSRSSSSRAAATTRRPSPTTSPDGRPASTGARR